MANPCAQGLGNAKEIELLSQRTVMMFEKLSEGQEKMDRKLGELDSKIVALKDSIPGQIREAVDIKRKTGVYGVSNVAIAKACYKMHILSPEEDIGLRFKMVKNYLTLPFLHMMSVLKFKE